MKNIFNKLSKIMFVAGSIALIILVLITVNSSNDIIDGMWGTILFICLMVILVFGVFCAISVVLGIIEGLKKDKVAFLKKFLSNAVWISIAYIVPYILDYFYEVPVSIKFEFAQIPLRVFLIALAIVGGEYMFADHSKDDKDELHF